MVYQEISKLGEKIKNNVGKVIIGKSDKLEIILAALISGGHVLLEDVPGTGKTVMAKSLAKSMDCKFARIQFTPDLLPSDVTGMSVFRPKEGDFEFKKGPVFTNILLADEINRATPRTQSALLECMEERQVTESGVSRKLDDPFLVVATQNPVEIQGTFPLPEAQLDRFQVRLSMGYPDKEEANALLERFIREEPLEKLEAVASADEMRAAAGLYKQCQVSKSVMNYMVDICEATRKEERVRLGVSPRGLLALLRLCQAYAALQGRDFVTPDDVKKLAVPALAHRIVMKNGFGGSKDSIAFVKEILDQVAAPTENEGNKA